MDYAVPFEYRYNKDVIAFVSDLIHSYKYKSYDDLSSDDKAEFAAFLNEVGAKDRRDYECLVEHAHLDQTLAAMRKMLKGRKADEEVFVETLKLNVIDYYEPIMRSIFWEIYSEYVSERRYESYELTNETNY